MIAQPQREKVKKRAKDAGEDVEKKRQREKINATGKKGEKKRREAHHCTHRKNSG